MKVNIVLSINDNSVELSPGTIVSLEREPENPKDPKAVKAVMDGQFVGYVANSPETVLEGCSAATVVAKRLSRQEVAGINARLLSSYERPTKNEGITQVCWIAELYFIPVWDSGKDAATAATILDIGGNSTLHRETGTVVNHLPSYNDGGLVLKLEQVATEGRLAAYVYRSEQLLNPSPASAGEVQNPPDALMAALQTTATIPVTPVEVTGKRTYKVSVNLDTSHLEKFNTEMDQVVRNCVMQVRDIKERVSYLLSQSVPDPLIRAVLQSMRPLDDSAQVEKPKQLYFQTGGDTALTRAIGYYLAGKNLRLVGEKGTGKNTLISSVCWAFYQPFCRVQGNADMDKLDLMGSTTLDEKGTSFELSAFIKAIQTGYDAVLDEVNAVKPEVALILHSLADDAKSVEVPGYGLVKAHPRAHIWATMNEEYVGTSDLNDATADRFVPLYLDQQANIKGLLKERFPEIDESVLTICGTVYGKILDAVKSGRCSSGAITTRGYIYSVDASKYKPNKKTLLDNIAGRPSDRDERETIRNFINAACPA